MSVGNAGKGFQKNFRCANYTGIPELNTRTEYRSNKLNHYLLTCQKVMMTFKKEDAFSGRRDEKKMKQFYKGVKCR